MNTAHRLVGGLLAVAICVAAGEARTIGTVYLSGGNDYAIGDLPETFLGGVKMEPDQNWVIPNLTVADIGTIFTLNHANQGSYGIDLAAFEHELRYRNVNGFRFGMFVEELDGSSILGSQSPEPNERPRELPRGTIEEIRFGLRNYNGFLHANVWMTVITPEPASAALLLVGLCGAGLHFRTRRI